MHFMNLTILVCSLYDVNRLQFAQTRISNNIDIFDIDGDGAYTSYDSDLIAIYLNNLGSTSAEYEALFVFLCKFKSSQF